MLDLAILGAWAEFAVRWLHVVTAIAWIGSSFYFIALDLGLRQAEDLPPGAHGEEWQVHGGGFYHIRKYLVAPAQMPEHLTWFKWESYATWLSGFALLVLVYYVGAEFYLIDPGVRDLAVWQAIAISLASLGFGWLVYDALCRSRLGETPTTLMLILFALLVVMSWAYTQVFTGRAALLHLGAFTATIMSANVFLIIIPNQKIVVADLIAGRKPDPKYGKIAKLRSTHNNYLTLPVVFLMLSNHYPLAFASQWNWLIASLVFLMGVTIRHWFNTRHARAGSPHWTWLATVLIFLLITWLSTASLRTLDEDTALGPTATRFARAPGFDHVAQIVQGRCAMCHAAEPVWPGLYWAPRGVVLETDAQIATQARSIYLQAGASHAMAPANLTRLDEADRAAIRNWYRAGHPPCHGRRTIDRARGLRQSTAMLVYKILRRPEWDHLVANGSTPGAPVDLADGYIHLSTAAQVTETAAKHFAGESDLVLLALDADGLGPALRWEPSRGGQLFPHLYRPLDRADILWDKSLPLGATGHIFPEGVV